MMIVTRTLGIHDHTHNSNNRPMHATASAIHGNDSR
jgi:hypothetical protein